MTADARSATAEAVARLEPMLWRFARRLTQSPDLQDDLVQEARVELWELDATRFDFGDSEDLRYLGRCLRNRMWTVWHRELRRGIQ